MLNNSYAQLRAFWHTLPQWFQTIAVIFAAAAAASLGKAFSDPAASCWHWSCIRHDLGAAIGAGVVAVRVFYMRPGPGRQGGPLDETSQKTLQPAPPTTN